MSANEPMTEERLDAIRGRVDKSSWTEHEPWAVYDDGLTVSVCVEDGSVPVTFVADRFLRGEDNGEADARITAHAPQDLTDLLAEVERLRALTTVEDDMVERAALVLGNRRHRGIHRGWAGATSAARDGWRDEARAALARRAGWVTR